MSEFFSMLKVLMVCGTVVSLTMMVLLALPQSRMRSVALEVTKWSVVAGLALLTVSPIDLIPMFPLDDIGYVLGAIASARSAMGDRRKRLLLEQIEFEQLQVKAREQSHG